MSLWFRVVDPMSPLFGCDVKLGKSVEAIPSSCELYGLILALRRVDITVGDRAFQLVAPLSESLGLLIKHSQLRESPIQEDVVEMTKESLYGEFRDENLYRGPDSSHSMMIVRFDKAVQAALLDEHGKLMASNTWYSDDRVELTMVESSLIEMLGADTDALVTTLKTGRIE